MEEEGILSPHIGSCRQHSPKGVYVVLFESPGGEISVGSLGERLFPPGWYGYVGSALSPGGFARVKRHHLLYLNRDRPPHWHIDYLLHSDRFRMRYAIFGVTEKDLECSLADRIGPPAVPGFGCSDCRCSSHLFFRREDPREEMVNAMKSLGIDPSIQTIKNPGR